MEEKVVSERMRGVFLLITSLLLSVGACGTPLITRLYFVGGGARIWLSSWLQTSGWPLTIIPLAILYFLRRKSEGSETKFYLITPRIFVASLMIGVTMGLDGYLYSWGSSRLPVSTSSLLIAVQLAFTTLCSLFIVKLKLTPYSFNAVVLLIAGAVSLSLRSNGDRPEGVTNKAYLLGFIMTFLAAALNGVTFPCIELIYLKANQTVTAALVLETQMVMGFAATAFCTIGMIANNDFQAISREAKQYNLGESRYYTMIVCTAILWQCYLVGFVGVIYCSSSLMCGVTIATLLPVTELLGVIFFGENFPAEKGLALFLCLWGFVSYYYGEFTQTTKKNDTPESEIMERYELIEEEVM